MEIRRKFPRLVLSREIEPFQNVIFPLPADSKRLFPEKGSGPFVGRMSYGLHFPLNLSLRALVRLTVAKEHKISALEAGAC